MSSCLALLKALAGHAEEDRHRKTGTGRREEERRGGVPKGKERDTVMDGMGKVMDHADVGQRELVYFSVKRKRKRTRRKEKAEVMGATS